MRRRDFIGLLPGSVMLASAWSMPARAQAKAPLPTIGWIAGEVPLAEIAGPDPINLPARAFLHGLRDLGWIDGRTVNIERRSAESRPERFPEILAELVARKVDVIFTAASDWLADAVHRATSTIPIVAVYNRDPVAAGYAANLARPGGNMTGVVTSTGREFYEKRVQLFRELVPNVSRMAFLGTSLFWEAYRSGADPAATPPIFAPVDRPEEFDRAFATVLQQRADALLVSHGPLMFINIPRLVAFAERSGLPAVYPWREASEAGGLMSYGSSGRGLFRQAARYVDRILKGGRAAELPIEQPTQYELVINLKTATTLGLAVPASLLARADEVIE